ncbi:SLC13 family permease [Methylobacterium sp. NEAU 140]|uniref:SLC13 family permease n=1 Tax=Methylobacterium sp. NEAU 140 TaxID=3064945 RepID=UPI0027350AEE|nr:SLC13 family permease [Methylobacterium sp. NEAU 140]MDP4026878.1 SLC13 family permease [Methylobacterium sp. NEAU 140]
MTYDQALAFGLLGLTIAAFVWDRLPYDLVALTALAAGIGLGLVPADKAFSGFSDDIVIIVGCALVLSAAIARSGAVETLMRPLTPRLRSVRSQVPALVGGVLALSMVTKNVGALAIFMPIALQLARRTGTAPASLLMPMAFASLIGGLVTLVGTSPNVIVSKIRADLTGKPFGMFDYTPVGLSIAVTGFLFLSVGWRLLPRDRRGAASLEAAFNLESYTTEARLPAGGPAAGLTIAEAEALDDGGVRIATVVRERFRRYPASPEFRLADDDILLLRGEQGDLERFVARVGLALTARAAGGDDAVVEGVVTAESDLVGRTPTQFDLRGRHALDLLAVSRRGRRIEGRLSTTRLRAGDVVVLRGAAAGVPEALGALRVLPLAARALALGRNDRSWRPALVLAAAMALVAAHLVPVAVAFFGAVVAILLLRSMTPHEAYAAVEWPVLVLLGALIPVSEAISTTGGADLIAAWLTQVVQDLSPTAALAATLVLAMAVTPFLNNAATVLVMGPIAARLAERLGLNVDPFLMAVALGAACDFLTPIGHQCNTLVMGPGGYRFGDYARLGFPLSILVIALGVPLIALFWPLRGT